jgi:hypothetical protein
LDHLFRYFEHTAFRLETRPSYAVAEEQEMFAEFLAGEPRPFTDIPWYRAWYDQIATLTSQGKRVARVRLLDEPPTEYQRFEIWVATFAEAAGESIRYLDRGHAVQVGLPTDVDWWLFDSARLALMRFDELGHPLGGEIITDPTTVSQHRAWWDLAVQHSVSDPGQSNARVACCLTAEERPVP